MNERKKVVKEEDDDITWFPCGSQQTRILGQLLKWLRTPARGSPILILVGPSGIGKSEIVQHAIQCATLPRTPVDLDLVQEYIPGFTHVLDNADSEEWRDTEVLAKAISAWKRDHTGHLLLICSELGHASSGLRSYINRALQSTAGSGKRKRKGKQHQPQAKEGQEVVPLKPQILYMNAPSAQEIRTFLIRHGSKPKDADSIAVKCAGDLRQAQFLLQEGGLLGNCWRDMSPFALASRLLSTRTRLTPNDDAYLHAMAHNKSDHGFLRGLLVHSYLGADLDSQGKLIEAACDTDLAETFLNSIKGSKESAVESELTEGVFSNLVSQTVKSKSVAVTMPPTGRSKQSLTDIHRQLRPHELHDFERLAMGPKALFDYVWHAPKNQF